MSAEPTLERPESTHASLPGEPLLPGLLAWQRLGGGNHCETWLCWSTDLWSPVAVKLARPDDVADADVWQDLLVESSVHGRVRHPGFQRLWSSDLAGRVPHLVLEYVEGPSLATLHDQRALTVPDVVLLGLQLASSLRYLHRQGLVHLDVKPSNVVVREGRAVLLDLGIVTAASRSFAPGEAPGTPAYMPPELHRDGAVHAATDVFALGVTLTELLGRSPVPASLRDLLDRMTRPDPAERPDDETVLAGLRTALPAGSPGLWPAWASRALGDRGAGGVPHP